MNRPTVEGTSSGPSPFLGISPGSELRSQLKLARSSCTSYAVPIPPGITEEAWVAIAKIDGHRWAIEERDAEGNVIGTSYRDATGGKTCKPGGKRGLILRWPLKAYAGSSRDDPVYITEGASDMAALMGLGLDAVGAPMAGQCGDMLAQLLAGRHVVIVADADRAGRRGAEKLASALVGKCASVRIIDPPDGAKDAREAVITGASISAFRDLTARAISLTPKPEFACGAQIEGAPVIVRLSDVKPESVAWLWPGRIALGKITLIAGDPGLGKSFLTLDIATRVSRGMAWPDAPNVAMTPGGVVLLSAEDGIADTIRPRLDAAGADVSRIVALEAIRSVGENGQESVRTFDLSRDLLALESAIRAVEGCRLVVIDPITAYLGGVDSHKNAEVRGLLAQLSAIAERHQVAMIAVTHLNKSSGGLAIYRAMGSLAFAAAARAAWVVSKDKDDALRRLLLPIKNNIAPDTGGLAYRIEPLGVDGFPVVAWEPDAVNLSADDALSSDREPHERRTEREDAARWLQHYLCDGPKLASDVLTESKAMGFSKRTIDRAKRVASIRTRKEAFGGGWVWERGSLAQGRQPDSQDCHTPDAGNLVTKPPESRENYSKIATPERSGNLGHVRWQP